MSHWVQRVTGRVDLQARLAEGRHRRGPFVAKTADYTCTAAESGTIFTTRGNGAAINFTLPALGVGLWYTFVNLVGYNMEVIGPTANELIAFNDLTASSIGFQTVSELKGGVIVAICDGTSWVAFSPSILNTLTVT